MIDAKAALAVAVGGAIGAAARYAIGAAFLQRFGGNFPWGTLFINLSGSFLIGVIAQLALTRALGVTPMVRAFAAVGVLGGYTTFSTYSFETLTLIEDGAFLRAAAYAAGSAAAGVVCAYLGVVSGRAIGG